MLSQSEKFVQSVVTVLLLVAVVVLALPMQAQEAPMIDLFSATNVRSGPGTHYSILGVVAKYNTASLTITGRADFEASDLTCLRYALRLPLGAPRRAAVLVALGARHIRLALTARATQSLPMPTAHTDSPCMLHHRRRSSCSTRGTFRRRSSPTRRRSSRTLRLRSTAPGSPVD